MRGKRRLKSIAMPQSKKMKQELANSTYQDDTKIPSIEV